MSPVEFLRWYSRVTTAPSLPDVVGVSVVAVGSQVLPDTPQWRPKERRRLLTGEELGAGSVGGCFVFP